MNLPHETGPDEVSSGNTLKRRSILFRTAMLSWIVTVLALALFIVFIIPYQRDILIERLESTAEVVATSIDQVAVTSIVVEDYSTVIDHCLKVVKDRPSVLYLVITRKDGFSLIHTSGGWRYQTLGGHWRPSAGVSSKGAFRHSDVVGENVFHYAHPLRYSGIDWGWIHIGLSLKQFSADLRSIYFRTTVLAILCVLASSVFFLIFARRLSRPLRMLSHTTKQVASGNLTARCDISTGDEVESLARSFNQMTEALQKAQDGLERRVEERTAELSSANVRLTQEITQRKQTEQELVRLERLRALGEMAAGVSHNLNNILTGVLGPAQILQMMTDDPQFLSHIDTIMRSGERATDLVARLHKAVRGSHTDKTGPVDVNRTVLEAVRAARPRWKDEMEARGIALEIITDLEEEVVIRGTPSGLHDIMLNLLFNAVDAMPEGGTIIIATRTIGENVQITVSDTGIGMNETTRRRVFEPFFTTKANVGTGLGLSTVYGSVTRWGGSIHVESKPGKGATFSMQLPVCRGPDVSEKEIATVHPTRQGKILIVEDEEIIRSLLSDMLSRNHEVQVAIDGRQAMERFLPGRYDVALIDLGMPEMPGDQVARKMKAVDPSIVTVLVTGWSVEETDPRLAEFDLRLQKPFVNLARVQDVVTRALEVHEVRAEGWNPENSG